MFGRYVVRSEVSATKFGLFTDDAKKALSVLHITSGQTFDDERKPIEGGLYDVRMGPLQPTEICVTCNLNYSGCPGHTGHIELDFPVYYPMYFAELVRVLRSKCIYCHRLLLSAPRLHIFLIRLKLLEMGEIAESETILDWVTATPAFTLDDNNNNTQSNVAKELGASAVNKKFEISLDAMEKIKAIERRYERYVKYQQSRIKSKHAPTDQHVKALQRNLIDSLFRSCRSVKRCETCGAYYTNFRQDANTKIFQKSYSKRHQKAMDTMRMKYKPALNQLKKKEFKYGGATVDDHDDEDDDEAVYDSLGQKRRKSTGRQGTGGDLEDIEDTDSDDADSDDDDENQSQALEINDENEDEEDDTDQESKTNSNAFETQAMRDAKPFAPDKYLMVMEVEAQMKLLWSRHPELLNFIWSRPYYGSSLLTSAELKKLPGYNIFFTRVVVVPPNKFRPASVVAEMVSDHPQVHTLRKVIENNSKLKVFSHQLAILEEEGDGNGGPIDLTIGGKNSNLSKMVAAMIELQQAVNFYMDSSKATPAQQQGEHMMGIKQLLEKKEGLFRQNMMGKRVNYCCRSVISPDPYLGTNEVGIPVHFAKELQYPEPVNDWNIAHLRKLVERGPNQYPGANMIETAEGKIIRLEKLSAMERIGKAKLLQTKLGNKVYRHLIDGDALLVNRQPTLHKASIMAHRARVLKHVKEQTIRLNYANCSSYNADFDGDEMNCHFVQSELARAEAYTICNTDNQYIVPTSGAPIRGLIQDHVASAVKLTCKDTFLTKADYQQLLFVALNGLSGTEIVTAVEMIVTPAPTIWKPTPLWTGKQVISGLLTHLCRSPLPSIQLDGRARTPPSAFGEDHGEHIVTIRHGELLTGVLDKSAIGNASLGLVHTVYELYGAELAGRLLNSFARVFTLYLQDAGHSCGMEDLVLKLKADKQRNELLQQVEKKSKQGLQSFLLKKGIAISEEEALQTDTKVLLGRYLAEKGSSSGGGGSNSSSLEERRLKKAILDSEMQSIVNDVASEVIKACLPNGLRTSFLSNHFSMMVMTGAKGSVVNQSQISCLLGQQALEGQRVPMMVSGKTLPSFFAYDGSARAGGFVRDRFLTGVKPQEYYFHCMAGREGLVDTAVKTSRSGYLQRCLVKHLEELKVSYDMTVRDSSSNIIQFLYGEDGIDPVHSALLGGKANQFLFLARNHQALAYKFSLHADFFTQGLEMNKASQYRSWIQQGKKHLVPRIAGEKMMVSKDMSSLLQGQELTKGCILQARRKKNDAENWMIGNLASGWHSCEIVKVRSHSHSSSSQSSQTNKVDIRYLSDGKVEKKLSIVIFAQDLTNNNNNSNNKNSSAVIPVYLLRGGLADPPMSTLNLGSAVGAISETLQQKYIDYIHDEKTLSDRIIELADSEKDAATSHSALTTVAGGSKQKAVVSSDALELLLWVKYMRSLAVPGEAVGPVAAQSVGEPSTQMTLNTFHLAGHGGANVTLGIPRLREILMTASKSLKTPQMTITIHTPPSPNSSSSTANGVNPSKAIAEDLARRLTRVTLAEILNHQVVTGTGSSSSSSSASASATASGGGSGGGGGIEVGEEIYRATPYSRWERKYRIRLHFQEFALIAQCFSLTIDDLISIIRTSFVKQLDRSIKIEQRRAGESSSGKHDPLKAFRSQAKGGAEDEAGGQQDDAEDDSDRPVATTGRGKAGSSSSMAAGSGSGGVRMTRKPAASGAAANGAGANGAEDDGIVDRDGDNLTGPVSRAALGKKAGDDEDGSDDGEDDEAGEDEDDDDEDDDNAVGGATQLGKGKSKQQKNKLLTNQNKDEEDDDDEDKDEDDESMIRRMEEPTEGEEEDDNRSVNSSAADSVAMTPTSANQKKQSKDGKSSSTGTMSKKKMAAAEFDNNRSVEHSEEENWIQITLYVPVTSRRLLMAQLAEKAASVVTITSTKNITKAYAIPYGVSSHSLDPHRYLVQTEGVNFTAIWQRSLPSPAILEYDLMDCNDIHAILSIYGVEAARTAIVKEIQAVFNVYGIDVNYRHLSLIADFMTRNGGFTPMNRQGMVLCSSPFLQMSFETTVSFLTKAVMEGLSDIQQSPSARIVMGEVPKVGTGVFDLLLPMNTAK